MTDNIAVQSFVPMMAAEPIESVKARVLAAALSGLSKNSCRVYTRHITRYVLFLESHGHLLLSRESAERYTNAIPLASSRNQALSAVKRLALQAAEHGWIDYQTALQIDRIPAKKQRGVRSGNWLTIEQSTALLKTPNPHTLPGKRDRAILALLLGCGLRRDELSRLTVEQYQLRDSRSTLIDVLGKGNRIRSITVPAWADRIIRDWWIDSGIDGGPLIRSFKRNGKVGPDSLSVSAIWDIVKMHTLSIGLTKIAPHDLRRTYAKLARKGGAELDTLRQSLGHAHISTTEIYLDSGNRNAGDFFSL